MRPRSRKPGRRGVARRVKARLSSVRGPLAGRQHAKCAASRCRGFEMRITSASAFRRVLPHSTMAGCLAAGVLLSGVPALAAERTVPPPPVESNQQTNKTRGLRGISALGNFVPGEVIVTFAPQIAQDERTLVIARQVAGGKLDSGLSPRVAVVSLPDGSSVRAAAARLRRDPAIAWAEPNWYYLPSYTPNDPKLQWGLRKAKVTLAWDIEPGGDPATVIAIVDSGIDANHPDLDDNLWTNNAENPANGVDDDANGYVDDIHGWDFVQSDKTPQDPNGHGTHVAGIAAAEWDNGKGGSGVCPLCSLMILRAMDASGRLATSDIVAAIRYAANKGADVINLSFGGSMWSRAQRDAIANAISRGSLVVAAAGNESRNNDKLDYVRRNIFGPSYPASYDLAGLVSVAASTSGDGYASFSNFGHDSVDLAAPGVDIFSSIPDDTYKKLDGTSMSSPFVAGLAGLLRSAKPTWTAIQTKDAILNGVDTPASLGGGFSLTSGRVNAFRPLDAPDTSDATPTHDGVMSGAVPINFKKIGVVSFPRDVNDIYKMSLRRGQVYAALLKVPARRDFDLFVWKPGAQDTFPTDQGCGPISCFLRSVSNAAGKGRDEYVKFRAKKTATYYFHVNAHRGGGKYTLLVGHPSREG